jgi:hypothetical protein
LVAVDLGLLAGLVASSAAQHPLLPQSAPRVPASYPAGSGALSLKHFHREASVWQGFEGVAGSCVQLRKCLYPLGFADWATTAVDRVAQSELPMSCP